MVSVIQEWVSELTMMQQSVLLSSIRAPDGLDKYHPAKYLIRWFRRCVLISALDKDIKTNPIQPGGGSFTGPSLSIPSLRDPFIYIDEIRREEENKWREYKNHWEELSKKSGLISNYLKKMDEVPHHFHTHFMHATQILGYKHPDDRIRKWWYELYITFVDELHLRPESEEDMSLRLSDNKEEWLKRSHPATSA